MAYQDLISSIVAEKANGIDALFDMGKKKRKNETSAEEMRTSMEVETIMAKLEIAAEDDAEFIRQGKPAINKLKKMPLLIEALSKKHLQQAFLDHGVLSLLKTWLDPLPNMYVRGEILKLLKDYPLDLDQCEKRNKLKSSGVGKIVMMLSKCDNDASCRKLAAEIVDKWSRPLFNKSAKVEEKRVQSRRQQPPLVKSASDASSSASSELTSSFFASRRVVAPITKPEVSKTSFVVRPPSMIDPFEAIFGKPGVKAVGPDWRAIRMNDNFKRLKSQNKKQRQVYKPQC